jgi:CRP-like cAMP-binding protein
VPAGSNAILSALEDGAALRERLKPIPLTSGQMLGEIGKPISQVIFPTAGLISVVAQLTTGERIETALIGQNGVFGGACALGAKTHMSVSFVQSAGAGLAVRASDFVELAARNVKLTALLFQHEQYLLAQTQQSVACNARHQIPQRLATWLLRAADAAEQKQLHLTQEFLAQMLGVQRASVSQVATKLQDDGLIRYQRGRIDILDETRLNEAACECREAVRTQRRRLFDHHD